MLVGYARVSSKGQNLSRQLVRLKNKGCQKIFTDKISGAKYSRPGLSKMLKYLRNGSDDTVMVTAIDRLGRKVSIINKIMSVIKSKGAMLNILAFPKMKTNNKAINHLIMDILIEVYSWEAEAERKEIRERQRQGIAIAKSNGKYKGKSTKFNLEYGKSRDAIREYFNRKNNHLSATDIAKINGMSRSTLYRVIRRYKALKDHKKLSKKVG